MTHARAPHPPNQIPGVTKMPHLEHAGYAPYGDRSVSLGLGWVPSLGETGCCAHCDTELEIIDGEYDAHRGADEELYCGEACEHIRNLSAAQTILAARLTLAVSARDFTEAARLHLVIERFRQSFDVVTELLHDAY